MKILNLTGVQANEKQLKAGVVDLPQEIMSSVASLLVFNTVPSLDEMYGRGVLILNHITGVYDEDNDVYLRPEYAKDVTHVLINGPIYFMSTLEEACRDAQIIPMYEFDNDADVCQLIQI